MTRKMSKESIAEPLVKKFEYQDFFIEKELGGSYNTVYLTAHKDLGRCVLKVVARNFYAKPKLKQKLETEAIAMLSLRHDCIMTGYGFVIEPEHVCLVYEFAEHGCLRDALHCITIAMALKTQIAYQINLAMKFLHNVAGNPVLHCNLKASNVFLTRDFTVKVGDFLSTKTTWMSTISQHNDKSGKESQKEEKGTQLAHIPPESLENMNRKPSKSCDVYAYGVILWELLTNKVPFEDLSTTQVIGKVCLGYTFPYYDIQPNRPLAVFEVMVKSLSRNPEDRPTFREMSLQLKPTYEAISAEARSVAAICQKNYESYRVKIRDEKRMKDAKSDKGPSTTFAFPPSPSHQPSLQKMGIDVTTQETANTFSQITLENRRSYFELGKAFSNKSCPFVGQEFSARCSSPGPVRPPPYDDSVVSVPALESKRHLDWLDYDQLYRHLGKEWKQLARVMGLFDGEIDAIDHDRETLNEKIAQMVRKWKNRKIGATVSDLARVLIDSDLGFIATELKP